MTQSDPPAAGQPLEQLQHVSATARVPDPIGRGIFATGAIVLHGANEYTIDFVQSLAPPSRVAARVNLPPAVASQFAIALEQAIETFARTFGQPPREPQPPAPPPPTPPAGKPARAGQSSAAARAPAPAAAPPPASSQPIAEVYDSLKLPDDMLGGVYANMVSISNTGSEFCFDFIAQLFPRSVVTARVYMAAPRAPELLASLKRSIAGG